MSSNTYWNNNGKYAANTMDQLQNRIPLSGPCKKSTDRNKALERLRRAINVYHDLYNNGLCNYTRSFAGIFGFAASAYSYKYHYSTVGRQKPTWTTKYDNRLYQRVEQVMNRLVEEAAMEQGIDLTLNPNHHDT